MAIIEMDFTTFFLDALEEDFNVTSATCPKPVSKHLSVAKNLLVRVDKRNAKSPARQKTFKNRTRRVLKRQWRKKVLEVGNQNPNLSTPAITNLLEKTFGIVLQIQTVARILRINGRESARKLRAVELNNAVVEIATENALLTDSEIAILAGKKLNRHVNRRNVNDIIHKNGLRTKNRSTRMRELGLFPPEPSKS